MQTGRGKGGRPTVEPESGKKSTLSLRVTGEMKSRLQTSANHAGRNLSEEAEARLVHSFVQEQHLEQAYEISLGALGSDLMRGVAEAVRTAKILAGIRAIGVDAMVADPEALWSDPNVFAEIEYAIGRVLDHFRPKGEPRHLPPMNVVQRVGETQGFEAAMDKPGEVAAVTAIGAVVARHIRRGGSK
jgi:hypothetical protein